MRSAFQIETEVNVICEIRFDASPGKVLRVRATTVRTDNDIKTYNGNDADDDRSLE
jgi:hypothetical protein